MFLVCFSSLAWRLAPLTLGCILVAAFIVDAQPGKTQAKTNAKQAAANEVIQHFPSNDVMRTAWKVHWGKATGFGLFITGAWFKKSPSEDWLEVLGDARLAEMFVPYASGSPRFWDVSYNFSLTTLTKEDAGPFGKLIGNPPEIVQEIRDRGLAWIDGTKGSRRGQELVLWSCLNAANYRYAVEYSFHDDGTIAFRVGSTGRNYGSREWEGHMHNGLWRVDVNLGGAEHNEIQVMEHIEPDGGEGGKARTDHRPFNFGKEGFEDWHAKKFTMPCVVNNRLRNVRNEPFSYDVVTRRMGNARHYGGDKEICTQHDFWVTRNRPGETFYIHLPKYVAGAESIVDTDVVLWLSTAGHHLPRSEDGAMPKGNNFVGATPVMWTGFELKPRNIWDRSPLYP